jgi:hypothetical protein
MSTDSITARYLREFDRPVLPLPESHSTKIRFDGRYLSRPIFLEAREVSGLTRHLSLVRSALTTLPDRLFGGDLRAFAGALGMAENHAECVVRSMGPSPGALTTMARADLYKDESGFRMLEWNFGATIGGGECVDMCRSVLAVPELAAFVADEGLEYVDTYEAILATVRDETGHPEGTTPVVAMIETPHGLRESAALVHEKASRWRNHGFSTAVGQLGELARADGRLCLRGQPVDVVCRLFTFEEMLDHVDDGLLEPLLSATERGEVVMFPSLDAEAYSSKGALALLSDPAGQNGLTQDQRDAIARLIPWTRQVRAGQTTLEDGSGVDLLAYALEHQHELVLKPSLSYGGSGVLVGSDPVVSPEAWRDQLTAAVPGSHVLQRLVRPVPELFPTETPGQLAAWTVAWGVFTMSRGYAGVYARGVPADARRSVVNFDKGGAFAGCGFHAPA